MSDGAISTGLHTQISSPPPPAVRALQPIHEGIEHATGGLASGGSPTGAGGAGPGDGSSTAGGGGATGGACGAGGGAGGAAGGNPVSGGTGTLLPAITAGLRETRVGA